MKNGSSKIELCLHIIACASTITDMATVRKFEVLYEKFSKNNCNKLFTKME
jgi:hypothetical protein